MKEKKGKKGIPWHPAFVVALKLTLIDYDDELDYKLEHPLNTEPLEIDVLVVKKHSNTVIKKQIAEIFRQENIIEYKSPQKSLSVNEFHRAFARTHLHKAIDNVKVADLTLSFVVTTYPRVLFRHLRGTLGYTVEERHPGIYVVTGAMIPVQILISGKLSEEENTWIRNLNGNLPEKNLDWLSRQEKKYGSRLDLSAYQNAVLAANQEMLKKMWEDKQMFTAKTMEIMEKCGLGAKLRHEGIEEGKLEAARAMFAEGDSLAKISRVTKIPAKTLKKKLSVQ